MTLLKGNQKTSGKTIKVNITARPVITIKDGWNFGIGFGLAMVIAVPLIVLLLSCIIGVGLSIIGFSLTGG